MLRPTLSRAINRPKLVFGVEKWTLLFAFSMGLIVMFAFVDSYGFWLTLGFSMGISAFICRVANLYTKRDPRFFSGRVRAIFHAASYDAGKFKPFRVEIMND